jgi:hypothetical protein
MKKGKRKKLDDNAKRMKTLNTFFKSSENLHLLQLLQSSLPSSSLSLSSPSLLPEISLFSIDNLHTRLKEIDQQCILLKFAKNNEKILTYDYL